MGHAVPDYVLVTELLGFGTGTVLSIYLLLLVHRAVHYRPGTRLLGICAIQWNVFGLLASLLLIFGAPYFSLTVGLVQAAYLSAGAIFPISFLQLWSRPQPSASWRTLYRIAVFNAAWLTALLFACPIFTALQLYRYTMYAVPLNVALLLTIGAFTQVRGRLSAAADRIYLALTLLGIWACTIAIFILPYVTGLPEVTAFLVVVKEQSPFLSVLGALFFFAKFRSSDVLVKNSLRVVAAVCISVCTCWVVAEAAVLGPRSLTFPPAIRLGIVATIVAAALLIFSLIDRFIEHSVDCWMLHQPDYRMSLQHIWDEMAQHDAEPEIFAAVDRLVSHTLEISAARILRRCEMIGIESHAAANAGRLWELSCDDPCRRALPGLDVDILAPVRVHGDTTHVIAVAPDPCRRTLLERDLKFLKEVAGQVGRRLETLQHERERMERQNREANLRRLAAQAELKALRAQINPHFLFNSLNTVADLIVTDPAKAESMTVLLAKVFRHVLMQSDRQLTPVSEEIEFLCTYLRIEEVRFGDRLRVTMNVDPGISKEPIPPLILQPVVENAIKHGLAPKIGKGNLNITADRQGDFVRLAVEDDGVGLDSSAAASDRNGGGMGLKIIAERLRTLYDGRASLSIDPAAIRGSRVTILIPRSEAAAATA